MKRPMIIVLVLLATTIGASVAEAAIRRGTLTGATEARDPMGLKIDSRGRAYSVYFEGVTLNCTDGDSFDTPTGADRVQTPRSVRFRIDSRRRWGFEARNNTAGNGYDVIGRFNTRGTRTTGTMRVFANFDEQNNPDPNGTVQCDSGELTFALRRRR